MTSESSTYDCVVLGAGPAGSTTAALVAETGLKTLLLERETMPRFHVGESLMPETYWVFERLGVLDQMKQSAHPKKQSVQFVNHSGKASAPFDFFEHDDRECSQTWQVRRADFDQMLYENAAKKGATCRDHTRVVEVLFEQQKAVGVRVKDTQGQTQEISARVVVDATGMQALMAHRLGLLQANPDLRKSAIWGYYQGAWRGQGADAGATIILNTQTKDAWFWYIPLCDDRVSVGVVGDSDYLHKSRGAPAVVFEEELANCPAVLEKIVAAQLVSPFRIAKEFSYATTQSAGDGWLLVGDALGFIDPIYSSGVFFALKSGALAADAIVEGFQKDDTSAEQLGHWNADFIAATDRVRKLVDAFYTREFSFGQFMRAYPQHKGNLTDLLIGRIFHPAAGNIFEDMDRWIEAAKAS